MRTERGQVIIPTDTSVAFQIMTFAYKCPIYMPIYCVEYPAKSVVGKQIINVSIFSLLYREVVNFLLKPEKKRQKSRGQKQLWRSNVVNVI